MRSVSDRARARLNLERLEERLVPAIVFQPQLGAETVHIGDADPLYHSPGNPIFWGPTWKTPRGPQSQPILNATKAILASSYLNRLSEYQYGPDHTDGPIGGLVFGSVAFDTSDPINKFSFGDIRDVVSNAIGHGIP